MIEIDKKIPMEGNKVGRKSKYPFGGMEVGDSFFVDGVKSSAIRNLASTTGQRLGKTFSVRIQGDGYRVWRTE